MKAQRTLPPAAAPLIPGDLLRGLTAHLHGSSVIDQLTKQFQEYFGVNYIFWVTSGKAALALILLGLKRLSSRRKVVIPAYTCFSVPSSVIKAGLEVELCDVDPSSLDFDAGGIKRVLGKDTLAVVPTHLMGYYADVEHVIKDARRHEIFVIEDVAQAFGGVIGGKPLGTLGDVAFLSFGRGKNITCGSAGIILTNSPRIAQAIQQEYESVQPETVGAALSNLGEVAAMQFLIQPEVFWLPAGLPCLKLGETKFYRDFPIRRMDQFRAGLLASWKERLAQSTDARGQGASALLQGLERRGFRSVAPQPRYGSANLRFPFLTNSSDEKQRLLILSKERGLGISPCYPTTIQQIPELQTQLKRTNVPGALVLAERLVTLPTHRYIVPSDRERILSAVVEVCQRDNERGILAEQR